MASHGLTGSRLLMWLRRIIRNDQLILSVLALFVGAAGGGAVILFREAIVLVQTLAYGSGTESLYRHAEALPWWHLILAPSAGGLLIGLLVSRLMPGRRPQGVAAEEDTGCRFEGETGYIDVVTHGGVIVVAKPYAGD